MQTNTARKLPFPYAPPSIQNMTQRASENYAAAMQETPKPARPFAYGDLLYIVEDLHVTILSVYRYDDERVYCVRANGVRTSVSRNGAIWKTLESAEDALKKKRRKHV